MTKELCWNITSRCNQDCIYCFRALDIPECQLSENMTILDYIHGLGIKELTWSGGEPLMYPHLSNLLRRAKELAITNKINTNASLFVQKAESIMDYVDNITFSLDSMNSATNFKLGRGRKHYKIIDKSIQYVKNNHPDKQLTINIVASKFNLNDLPDLVSYLNFSSINSVRVFQISPIRGRSLLTHNDIKISNETFEYVKEYCKLNLNAADLTFRNQGDLEEKYLVISPDGNLCYSKDGKDIIIKNLREATR
jgi:MoaA/NifB/PqqE/SkfB family radical SAM enzyme